MFCLRSLTYIAVTAGYNNVYLLDHTDDEPFSQRRCPFSWVSKGGPPTCVRTQGIQVRVIWMAPLNAKIGLAQILWSMNRKLLGSKLEEAPVPIAKVWYGMCLHLSTPAGLQPERSFLWQNTEANPVLPLTREGL